MEIDEKVLKTLNGTLLGKILELMTTEEISLSHEPVQEGDEVVTELLPWEVACYTLFCQKVDRHNQLHQEMIGDERTDEHKMLHYECLAIEEFFWASLRGREVKIADAQTIGLREGNKVVLVRPRPTLGFFGIPGFSFLVPIRKPGE